jgi:hypothetical protein
MAQSAGGGDVDTATAQAASVAGVAADLDGVGALTQNGRNDEGFAALRIKRVVRETGDVVSLVLDVPASDAVAGGWVLTCQSVLTSQSVTVVYE